MLSHSVASDSLWPHWIQPARLLSSWVSPGKNTGVSNHFLFQRIFPTQGLNLGLLHCRWILYPPSYQGEVQIVGKLTNSKEISPHCFCFLDRFSPLFESVPSHSEKGGTWFPTSPLGQIFHLFVPQEQPIFVMLQITASLQFSFSLEWGSLICLVLPFGLSPNCVTTLTRATFVSGWYSEACQSWISESRRSLTNFLWGRFPVPLIFRISAFFFTSCHIKHEENGQIHTSNSWNLAIKPELTTL